MKANLLTHNVDTIISPHPTCLVDSLHPMTNISGRFSTNYKMARIRGISVGPFYICHLNASRIRTAPFMKSMV